ncbi:hypothetical protein ACVWWG_005238 [Bradyrhizobium sp. LB7.2]
MAASTSPPRLPEAEVTVVLKAAWPWSASVIEIDPVTERFGAVASSVTSRWVGTPMTAASLVPWTLNESCFWVPSRDVTVKVSVLT